LQNPGDVVIFSKPVIRIGSRQRKGDFVGEEISCTAEASNDAFFSWL